MRHLKYMLMATVFAVAPLASAHAEWYVGANAGLNFLQDSDAQKSGTNFDTEYDLGPVALGKAGYSFGAFSVEGELGFRNNGVDSLGNKSADGDASAYSLMTNVVYDFNPSGSFHPFVGAGIGAAYLDADAKTATSKYDGNEWAFAYQGFAGASYDLNSNWSVSGQYRYFATTDYEVSSPTAGSFDNEYAAHNVLLGLTYRFAAPAPVAYVPPAPVPTPAPAAPAPVVAAQPKNFMVFFDWDKAVVTPEASAIIQKAASYAKQNKSVRVDLSGHTDRSGTDGYNQKLSQARADAVRAEMVKLGIPADAITVVAKGESTPLVATDDNVREPQNRRVEILLP